MGEQSRNSRLQVSCTLPTTFGAALVEFRYPKLSPVPQYNLAESGQPFGVNRSDSAKPFF